MDDWEHLKLCAAREIWKDRNKRTPSNKSTWGEWFEAKFGENLFAYRERIKLEQK